MKISSGRMYEYSNFGQKLLPRTPIIVELLPKVNNPSVFKRGKFLPEVMCNVAGCFDLVVFGFTDYSSCSLLLLDYPNWENFEFRDPQILSSLAASRAALYSCDNELQFAARSFNLPKDEVLNYFIWRQTMLASNLMRMDGLKINSDSVSEFIDSGPSSVDRLWPGTWWRGRACRRVRAVDSDKQLFFWDTDLQTPVFSKNRDYINELVYLSK